jgi:menaquinone-dependent protoporphyrinogen oxidase
VNERIMDLTAQEGRMNAALVAYATKNGSTAEVAEAVADRIRAGGYAVEVADVRSQPSSVDRPLVIVAAPIYNGRWLRGARRFLERHRQELDGGHIGVFALGPREKTDEAFGRSRAEFDRSLTKLPWLHPITVGLFGGVDPPKKPTHRDVRDWSAIEAWTDELIDVLATSTR